MSNNTTTKETLKSRSTSVSHEVPNILPWSHTLMHCIHNPSAPEDKTVAYGQRPVKEKVDFDIIE